VSAPRVHVYLYIVKGCLLDLLLAWVLLESYNKTDGYYHDYRDCTNESPELCQGGDTVLTLDMMRRSMATATDMATVLGETVDPAWATVLAKVTPMCTVPVSCHVGQVDVVCLCAAESGRLVLGRCTSS